MQNHHRRSRRRSSRRRRRFHKFRNIHYGSCFEKSSGPGCNYHYSAHKSLNRALSFKGPPSTTSVAPRRVLRAWGSRCSASELGRPLALCAKSVHLLRFFLHILPKHTVSSRFEVFQTNDMVGKRFQHHFQAIIAKKLSRNTQKCKQQFSTIFGHFQSI